jgi:hypothetical protein
MRRCPPKHGFASASCIEPSGLSDDIGLPISVSARAECAGMEELNPYLWRRSAQNIDMEFSKIGNGFEGEDGGEINALCLKIVNIAASDMRFPFRHLELLESLSNHWPFRWRLVG